MALWDDGLSTIQAAGEGFRARAIPFGCTVRSKTHADISNSRDRRGRSGTGSDPAGEARARKDRAATSIAVYVSGFRLGIGPLLPAGPHDAGQRARAAAAGERDPVG